MKKVIVFTASPRKNSNSSKMAESFIVAAEAKGYEVECIDTFKLNIKPCSVCNSCFKNGSPCIADDDFSKAAEAIEAADAVVFAAPLYWYTFPAQMKLLIDKLYSFCVAEKDFAGKKAGLLACCGDEGMSSFEGIRFAFEKSFEFLKCGIIGEVLVPGVYDEGDIDRTDGLNRAAALADLI